MKPKNDNDISQIEGNASPEVKQGLSSELQALRRTRTHVTQTGNPFRGFETEMACRMQLTEISVLRKAEEPEKLEARVVLEVIVDEGAFLFSYTLCSYHEVLLDMLNGAGILHGGYSGMIINEHVSSPHICLELMCG